MDGARTYSYFTKFLKLRVQRHLSARSRLLNPERLCSMPDGFVIQTEVIDAVATFGSTSPRDDYMVRAEVSAYASKALDCQPAHAGRTHRGTVYFDEVSPVGETGTTS